MDSTVVKQRETQFKKRRGVINRLWLSSTRILSSGTSSRHLDVPLPTPCTQRSLSPYGFSRYNGTRRFYSRGRSRSTKWITACPLHASSGILMQFGNYGYD